MRIRGMAGPDVAAGMRLKGEAGWNQVEADWRRFLDLGGDGCFVAEAGGRVVGSVTTCRFGPVGWVAMLLVEGEHRGGGIGRALLNRAIEHLEENGVRSVRLDATPMGRPLYESLGFRVDFLLHRHAGTLVAPSAGGGGEVRPGEAGDLEAMKALDREATGTDRGALVDRLVRDNPLESLVEGPEGGPIRGFALWRPGALATQVGPCIAGPGEGRALLDAVGRRLVGRTVFIDIPAGHAGAVAWAWEAGLGPVRELWRMTRGEAVAEDPARLWASSGPEMG